MIPDPAFPGQADATAIGKQIAVAALLPLPGNPVGIGGKEEPGGIIGS